METKTKKRKNVEEIIHKLFLTSKQQQSCSEEEDSEFNKKSKKQV